MGEPSDENKDKATPETVPAAPETKPRFNPWIFGVLLLIIAASVAGGWLLRQANSDKSVIAASEDGTAQGPLKAYATGTLSGLITHATPKPLEDISFLDGEGNPLKVSDFKGRVVVLNLWATWCTPCRVELPTLAALQKAYDPEAVYVLPLSIDKAADLEKAREELALSPPLPLYIDSEVQGLSKWSVVGMPTTLILNADGLEVARFEGEADWSAPEVKTLIDAIKAP